MENKKRFEVALLRAHQEHLKSASDAVIFTEVVLQQMYCPDQDSYFDFEGDECVYEIPAYETYHGCPVIVSSEQAITQYRYVI